MRPRLLQIFFIFFILRVTGLVFMPFFLNYSPVLLLLISPFLHHLILISTMMPATIFLSLGISISLLQCLVGYELGKKLGEDALKWMVDRSMITSTKADLLLGVLRTGALFILVAIPGPLMAMLAGVAKLERRAFLFIMIPSQIGWILACYLLGVELEKILGVLTNFIKTNWGLLTLFFIFINLVSSKKNRDYLRSIILKINH